MEGADGGQTLQSGGDVGVQRTACYICMGEKRGKYNVLTHPHIVVTETCKGSASPPANRLKQFLQHLALDSRLLC